MSDFNVYQGSYSEHYGQGAFRDFECVIVALTQQDALGRVLEEYDDTTARNWDITEISTEFPGVTCISERGS